MCNNIDVTPYMQITEYPNPDDPSTTCLDVVGLQPGKGSDNPIFQDSPLFSNTADCNLYDICPADGESGGDRGNIGTDLITCTPGDVVAGAGEYPADADGGLANNPYRWTMPKFICIDYPSGLSSITLR